MVVVKDEIFVKLKQIQNAIKLSIAFPWYINVVRVPKTNETLVNRIISFINLLQRTNGFDANSSRQPLKAKYSRLCFYTERKS